jgi:hypothetical protein
MAMKKKKGFKVSKKRSKVNLKPEQKKPKKTVSNMRLTSNLVVAVSSFSVAQI